MGFEEHVEKAMEGIVETHQHKHPLYQPTRIHNKIVDSAKRRAAFVLFEQIDTDRCTPEGEGWLGDQYRYSVWYIRGNSKPKELYEDHAYIRATRSALTGTRGRDCTINLVDLLEDGVIATITPEGAEGAYGDLSQTKVKITLEGRIEEPDDFMEQAENLVKRIGDKLGYDYLRGKEQLKGKNVAAFVWGTENGSTYGFDTVYLVWKDRKGKLRHEEIANSRSTKDYLHLNKITEKGNEIIIDVRDSKYRIDKKRIE